MIGLSPQQAAVMAVLKSIEGTWPIPNQRQIGEMAGGLTSIQVHDAVAGLVKKGLVVKKGPLSRGFKIVENDAEKLRDQIKALTDQVNCLNEQLKVRETMIEYMFKTIADCKAKEGK
jgi:predicted transcriptional regulator